MQQYYYKVSVYGYIDENGTYQKVPVIVLCDGNTEEILDTPGVERWYMTTDDDNSLKLERKAEHIADFLNFIVEAANAREIRRITQDMHTELFENFKNAKKCNKITKEIYQFLQRYYEQESKNRR